VLGGYQALQKTQPRWPGIHPSESPTKRGFLPICCFDVARAKNRQRPFHHMPPTHSKHWERYETHGSQRISNFPNLGIIRLGSQRPADEEGLPVTEIVSFATNRWRSKRKRHRFVCIDMTICLRTHFGVVFFRYFPFMRRLD